MHALQRARRRRRRTVRRRVVLGWDHMSPGELHTALPRVRPAFARGDRPRRDHRCDLRPRGGRVRLARRRRAARPPLRALPVAAGMDAAPRARALVAVIAVPRSHEGSGHGRPLPQGVPPGGPALPAAGDARPHARGGAHTGPRWCDGAGGRLAVRRVVARRVPAAPVPPIHRRQQPPGPARRRSGRGCRRDLQGPRHGRDLRPRGPVQGRPRASHAAAGPGVVGGRVPHVRRGERHHPALRRAGLASRALLRRPRRRAGARCRGRHRRARVRMVDPAGEVDPRAHRCLDPRRRRPA